MEKCLEESEKCCQNKDCRYYIDYELDNNCSLETSRKNPDGLSLEEVGKRLHMEPNLTEYYLKKALKSISKKMKKAMS